VKSTDRLVVVSNRLPVRRARGKWKTSPGGLVAALHPLLAGRGGAWVGWPGSMRTVPKPFEHDGIQLYPLEIPSDEFKGFYEGFANGTLWPLYHDAVRVPEYHRSWWYPYVLANRRYAEATAKTLHPGDVAWIHDYQLQLVPGFLRELCPTTPIGFFLHIPFPPVELFGQLPWRRQILEGLMGADVLGFQTPGGAANFLRAVERYTSARVRGSKIDVGGRTVRVDAYPISIDTTRMEACARHPETLARANELRESFGPDRKILCGVDRMDYTKGIDVRLKALEGLFEARGADGFAFVQIAVPSRESVEFYAELREDIERHVGHLNGRFGEPGRVPIHYLYRSLPLEELVAYYLASDVMIVTPLRDGMNLVAKEYVASRLDDTGALILSEFAGAAHELGAAWIVNPHDVDGVQAALEAALDAPEDVRSQRMHALRRTVFENDVHDWARSFLATLRSSHPTDSTVPRS